MGTFFVTQKIWELEGRRIAKEQVEKAKVLLRPLDWAGPTWRERLFGKVGRARRYVKG